MGDSDGRLEALLIQAGVGLNVIDARTGLYVRVSQTFCDIVGYRRDELVGRSPTSITHPDDRERDAELLAGLRAGTIPSCTLDKRYLRPDGRIVWVHITVAPASGDADSTLLAMVEDITQRRLADAALRESVARENRLALMDAALSETEAELCVMFDAAPVGILQTDPHTQRILRVNAAMSAITGYTAEELLSLRVSDITHPDDLAGDRMGYERGLRGEPPAPRGEKRYIRKDGRVVWVDVNFRLLHDAQGRPTRTLAIVEDVTERRAADAALRLQTNALQAAANGIVITDKAGAVLWVNDAFTRLTGYSEADVLGRDLSMLRSGVQDEAFYRALWETIGGGRTWHGELVNRRKDGSLYSEEMTITPVRDAAGAVTHFIAIKQDVSARKGHAEALRASEDRYRALVDNLEDVVFSVDLEGRITFVNRAIARYGYGPEIVGRPLFDFVHPEDLASLQRCFGRRVEGDDPGPNELRWLDAAGKPLFLRTHARALRVDGRVVGFTGLATDVTRQRETEEQLRAAQRMEAIGRLAGGVAHDFNNLLSVILSYTELGSMGLREGDPLREDLGEIAAAAQRAAGLTRQLLAFSRRQVLEPEEVDLGALVGGLSTMLQRLIGEDVALQVEATESVPMTKVDRGQVEQVVMNLAVNARDAMPGGGELRITVSGARLDEERAAALELPPGDYVELAVIDTGEGMTPDVQARIFEPFFTTKAVGKGTGLGLSMVHGIVKQSRGGIAVDTAPGRGTSFRVYLPRHAREGEGVTHPSIAPASRREVRAHESILVVEDEGALRNVVQRVLTSAGYRVFVASNAGEALLFCEESGATVDLLLTDVVMPGMSGRKLAERLAPLCPSAKVMFMSGYTDELLEQHDVLGERFLRKPFDLDTLTGKVRSVLDEG